MVRLLALAEKKIPAVEQFPLRRHGVLVDRDAVHGVRALSEVAPRVTVRATPTRRRRASRPGHPARSASSRDDGISAASASKATLAAAVGSAENSRSAASAAASRGLGAVHERDHLLGERTLGQPAMGRLVMLGEERLESRRPGGARTSAAAPRSRRRGSGSSAGGTGTGWSWRRRAMSGRPVVLPSLRPVGGGQQRPREGVDVVAASCAGSGRRRR